MNKGMPHPGSIWGAYPERRNDAPSRPRQSRWSTLLGESPRYLEMANAALKRSRGLCDADSMVLEKATRQVVSDLLRDGFRSELVQEALACVAAHVERAMGFRVFPTQLVCAAALLDQRMAEMATGEGKTLSAGIAAAIGGLVGTPVHVLTANEYLASRDAATLAPLYRSLGLTVSVAIEADEPTVRQQSYQANIVYSTARTVAFDYLRDKLVRASDRSDLEFRVSELERDDNGRATHQPGTSSFMLRGLCMAIVDEADSILIDEAKMPLIVSDAVSDPIERSRVWQALDLARRLDPKRDYRLNRAVRRVALTPRGQTEVESIALEYGSIWLNRLHREELVEQALTALRLLHRDHDYLIRDGEIVIIDAITGRTAPGRIWSRGLHSAVAIKEGLEPPPVSQTRAQITYPRLFARYHHLCGLSGTLAEVASELRESYDIDTVKVPLCRPSRRRQLPARVFRRRIDLFAAAARRAHRILAVGRPVLITVDSVLDSKLMESILVQQGIDFSVLNAQTMSEEASIVARAGVRPHVTLATQMAGRGTDIVLSREVRHAGGLHVMNLQHNRSRRLDRQIAGRAGRQGQPGSYEHWVCLETPLLNASWLASGFERLAPSALSSGPIAYRIVGRAQRSAEREDAALRKATSRQDRDWSESLHFTTMDE